MSPADDLNFTRPQFVGASVARREDPRLLTGGGLYVADIKRHGMLHIAFRRSDQAHAEIKSINAIQTDAPKAMRKVHGQFFPKADDLGPGWRAPWQYPNSEIKTEKEYWTAEGIGQQSSLGLMITGLRLLPRKPPDSQSHWSPPLSLQALPWTKYLIGGMVLSKNILPPGTTSSSSSHDGHSKNSAAPSINSERKCAP